MIQNRNYFFHKILTEFVFNQLKVTEKRSLKTFRVIH